MNSRDFNGVEKGRVKDMIRGRDNNERYDYQWGREGAGGECKVTKLGGKIF